MSDWLIVEWDPQCLRAIDVQATGTLVNVRRTVELPHPAGQELPHLPGEFNRLLTEKQIRTQQVVVTLPRETVVMRRLELPETSDDELPTLVRFQAATKSSLPLDQLAIDYIPVPRRAGGTGREVLLAMVPKTVIDAIREFVAALGKELVAVRISPIGTAELAGRVTDAVSQEPDGATLLVARHGERIEISIINQRQLIFSHGARVMHGGGTSSDHSAIMTEISRGLVSFQNLNLGTRLTHAVLFGQPAEMSQLAEALRTRMQVQLRTVDPFSVVSTNPDAILGLETRSAYVGLLGSALSQTQSQIEVVNLLAPRQQAVKKDLSAQRTKLMAIAGGSIAALILLGYGLRIWALDAEISEKQLEIAQIIHEVKEGKPTTEAAQNVLNWTTTNVNWLDTLQTFEDELPPADRVYLSRVTFDSPQGAQGSKLTVEGQAREQVDILVWREHLLALQGQYQLTPKQIEQLNKEHYPWHISEELVINPAAAKPAVDKSAPAAKTPEKTGPDAKAAPAAKS